MVSVYSLFILWCVQEVCEARAMCDFTHQLLRFFLSCCNFDSLFSCITFFFRTKSSKPSFLRPCVAEAISLFSARDAASLPSYSVIPFHLTSTFGSRRRLQLLTGSFAAAASN